MAGPKGNTKATVHDVFIARVKDLHNRLSKKVKDGFTREGQREWYLPEAWLSTVDLHDIQALMTGFDRTAINDNYIQCMSDAGNPGTIGDVISLKQQLDYNAAEERALRLRHASVIRTMTHACGRRRGHYESRLFPEIERQVSDLIAAGAV